MKTRSTASAVHGWMSRIGVATLLGSMAGAPSAWATVVISNNEKFIGDLHVVPASQSFTVSPQSGLTINSSGRLETQGNTNDIHFDKPVTNGGIVRAAFGSERHGLTISS